MCTIKGLFVSGSGWFVEDPEFLLACGISWTISDFNVSFPESPLAIELEFNRISQRRHLVFKQGLQPSKIVFVILVRFFIDIEAFETYAFSFDSRFRGVFLLSVFLLNFSYPY